VIDEWDDRKLRAGQQWEEAIIERARRSRVFLFILTNRFIASDFCVGTELAIARKLYASRAAAIVPILVEDADWQIEELRDLQVIMPSGKPVNRSKRDEAWTAVAQAVRQMAEDLLAGRYFADVPVNLPAVPPLLPFAIGREQQADTIQQAIRAAPSHRPFVCVLSGEKQGQSEFIESLLTDSGAICKALNLNGAHYPLAIDGDVWARARESVDSVLNGFLSSQLFPLPPSADREGIAASLATHPGLTVVQCELSAAEWRDCGSSRFRQFLAYWAGWPDLKPDHPVIVFLSLRAEPGVLEIPGGISVPLPGVTQNTVQQWLASPGARRRFLVDRLRERLGELFAPHDRLPMEEFAARFLPILRRFQV
jgi:hypothetical protein